MKRKTRNIISIILVAVVILLVFFYATNKLAIGLFSNTQSGLYSFSQQLKNSFINFSEAQQLRDENESLKEEINTLTLQNAELQLLTIENQNLRDILNFVDSNAFEQITSNVVGRNVERQNTLLIDKGSRDGVTIGNAVIVGGGVMVGKVVDVTNNFSTVLLLTDSGNKVAVSTPEIESTIGLAEGEFGLSITISLIPQNVEIETDNIVITSGLQEGIPSGLVIGKVNRVLSNENELFKTATITPQVIYDDVTIVSVVKP